MAPPLPRPPVRPCPRCGAALAVTPLEAPSCLTCRLCEGRWLSPEDVAPWLRARAAASSAPPAPLAAGRVIIHSGSLEAPRSGRPCPSCLEPLELFNYGYDSGVVLERCAYGHGVWIPADRFDALAAFDKGNRQVEASLEQARARRAAEEETEDLTSDALYAASMAVPLAPLYFIPLEARTGSEAVERAPAPFVAPLLILVNVLVYAIQPHDGTLARLFIKDFGVAPTRVLAGHGPWTLLTSLFVHGSFLHLFFNMYGLWLFGRAVEADRGPGRFLSLYLACGFMATLTDAVFGWSLWGVSIGASGAIAGVFGAFMRLFPGARLEMTSTAGRRTVSARLYLALWFAGQVVNSIKHPHAHIAWMAHIGGFLAGWALAGPPPAPAGAPRAAGPAAAVLF
jgi:membrane associated rhomboid family serine protease